MQTGQLKHEQAEQLLQAAQSIKGTQSMTHALTTSATSKTRNAIF
jgi:hypothetical protein